MNIIDESSPLIGLAHEALRELQALSEKFQAEGCNVTLIVTSRDANGLNAMAIASTIDDHENGRDAERHRSGLP